MNPYIASLVKEPSYRIQINHSYVSNLAQQLKDWTKTEFFSLELWNSFSVTEEAHFLDEISTFLQQKRPKKFW